MGILFFIYQIGISLLGGFEMNYYLIVDWDEDYGLVSTELEYMEFKEALNEFVKSSEFDLESFRSFVYDKYGEDVNIIPYEPVSFTKGD